MSHTAVRTRQTELEHLEFARSRFAELAEELTQNVRSASSLDAKLVLQGLLEIARAGVAYASIAADELRADDAVHSSSH
jgi:hypothetical protein